MEDITANFARKFAPAALVNLVMSDIMLLFAALLWSHDFFHGSVFNRIGYKGPQIYCLAVLVCRTKICWSYPIVLVIS